MPFLVGDFEEWGGGIHARSVDQDVDASEAIEDGIAQAFDIGALASVALKSGGSAAQGGNGFGAGFGILKGASGDGDRGAGVGQAFGHRSGEHAAAPDYDGYVTVEAKESIH